MEIQRSLYHFKFFFTKLKKSIELTDSQKRVPAGLGNIDIEKLEQFCHKHYNVACLRFPCWWKKVIVHQQPDLLARADHKKIKALDLYIGNDYFGVKMYIGQKCLGAKNVSGPDFSQCRRTYFRAGLWKSTIIMDQSTLFEKMSLGWKCLKAGLVLTCLRPDMTQGWKCLTAGLVLTCLRTGLVSRSRAWGV